MPSLTCVSFGDTKEPQVTVNRKVKRRYIRRPKETDVPRSTPPTAPNIYHGELPSGRGKMLVGNVKKLGTGALFELYRPDEWRLVQPPAALQHIPDPEVKSIVMLDCIHHETRKPLRFVGWLEPNHSPPKPRQDVARVDAFETLSFSPAQFAVQAANDCKEEPVRKTQKKSKRGIDYSGELEKARQSLQQGTDPNMKMPFIEAHLNLSHSTVYRELKRGIFPPPIRRGKSVSWLFSQIEAYRLGNWPPA